MAKWRNYGRGRTCKDCGKAICNHAIKCNRCNRLGDIATPEELENLRIAHLGQKSWNKGKKSSPKTIRRLKESHKGHMPWNTGKTGCYSKAWTKNQSERMKRKLANPENHPMWLGGKSYEPYSPAFNKILKKQIKIRDGYKCQMCGSPQLENIKPLAVHHIDYDKKNSKPSNLITLCFSCHGLTNKNREYYKEKLWTLVACRDS